MLVGGSHVCYSLGMPRVAKWVGWNRNYSQFYRKMTYYICHVISQVFLSKCLCLTDIVNDLVNVLL